MARFVFFFVVLAAIAIIGSLFSMLFRQIGKWNQVMRQMAERYGGHVKPAGAFANPALQFIYGEHVCHLKFRRGNLRNSNGRVTELVTHWPDRKLQFRLNSKNFITLRQPSKRMILMTVDDQQFNDRFDMHCLPLESGQRLLSEGVRWHIEQLAKHCGDGALKIAIGGGLMSIAKPGYIRDQTQLDDFIRFSLAILNQFNLTRSVGIEFEGEDSAKLLEEVYCPICSEEIVEHMVVCVRCKTPHCQDCWEYNGQCATFACGEARFLISTSHANP